MPQQIPEGAAQVPAFKAQVVNLSDAEQHGLEKNLVQLNLVCQS
jgi:hypothetical protein